MTKTEDMAVPELVERVAHIIARYADNFLNQDADGPMEAAWDEYSARERLLATQAARAAIEAMMEPPNVVGCLGVRISSHDDEVLEIHLDHEAEGIDVVRLVHLLESHDRARASLQTKGEK